MLPHGHSNGLEWVHKCSNIVISLSKLLIEEQDNDNSEFQ